MSFIRKFLFTCFSFSNILLHAHNYPITFVPERKSSCEDDQGWETWYPSNYSSAMQKIINQNYRGYQLGIKENSQSAWNYNITTQLRSNQGTKQIFNFSYYPSDSKLGVISMSRKEKRFSRQEKEKISLLKRLRFGIGYSLGIVFEGYALSEDIFEISLRLITAHLHELHSLDFSLSYLLNQKNSLEIQTSYLWVSLNNRKGFRSDSKEIKDFNIVIWRFAIAYYLNPYVGVGGAFYISKATTFEKEFYSPDSVSILKSYRMGRGGGVFLELKSKKSVLWKLYPFIKFEIGISKEYKNTSSEKWKDKLVISLTGVYLGIKLKIGG